MIAVHAPQTRKPLDRWIPWTFVAFFLVVAVANAVFVALALSSWTGLETEQAFAQGLAHDRERATLRAQATLGWQSGLAVTVAGDQVQVAFKLADRFGEAVTGGAAIAQFRRPTQAGLDFEMPLAETAAGQYRGQALLPALGQWEVALQVSRGADSYRAGERVNLR